MTQVYSFNGTMRNSFSKVKTGSKQEKGKQNKNKRRVRWKNNERNCDYCDRESLGKKIAIANNKTNKFKVTTICGISKTRGFLATINRAFGMCAKVRTKSIADWL